MYEYNNLDKPSRADRQSNNYENKYTPPVHGYDEQLKMFYTNALDVV